MLNATTTTGKAKVIKDWACQECGKLMGLKAAEKASWSGCTGCGGSDIFLASNEQIAKQRGR